MINNSDLKCPNCGSFDLKQAYQVHIGRNEDGSLRWTTRKYRDANGLKHNRGQLLIVPPMDNEWYRCNMCNSEFDGDGIVYKTLEWIGLYNEKTD